MALEVRRYPAAERDLVDIWRYVADDDVGAADRLLDRFEQVLRMLADNPRAGRARLDLGADLRSMAVGNYVLFYRLTASALELVRVRSGFRDVRPETFSPSASD